MLSPLVFLPNSWTESTPLKKEIIVINEATNPAIQIITTKRIYRSYPCELAPIFEKGGLKNCGTTRGFQPGILRWLCLLSRNGSTRGFWRQIRSDLRYCMVFPAVRRLLGQNAGRALCVFSHVRAWLGGSRLVYGNQRDLSAARHRAPSRRQRGRPEIVDQAEDVNEQKVRNCDLRPVGIGSNIGCVPPYLSASMAL